MIKNYVTVAIRKILKHRAFSFINIFGLAPCLIGAALAVPAAYFMNTMWLELFAAHVSVDWITVLIGVFILSLFGLITIGSQTLQAIFINPFENLKNE